MHTSLPDVERLIDSLIDEQRYDDALYGISVGVHNHYLGPEVAHRMLYYPGFDRQIVRLSALLEAGFQPVPSEASGIETDNTLIVASELYQIGGHSRVIEDCVGELSSATIVLTDVFDTCRANPAQLNWVLEKYAHITVLTLPQHGFWARSLALRNLTSRLQPRNILYFNHHQDAIAFVGTLGHRGSRKTMIHHGDHNPGLGHTLAALAHVDLTDELARTCAQHLQRETMVLPLFAHDMGRKAFRAIEAKCFSVVTSGALLKFARDGEWALKNIAHTVLATVGGEFVHIGPIGDDWVAEIRSHLAQQGIDPARFVPIGSVPSLWRTLAELDAHVYLGSAPLGGGRAAVESQGCGYPLLFFRAADARTALGVDSVYASKDLGWSTLPELAQALLRAAASHPRYSDAARALYESTCSHAHFRQVLGEIVDGDRSDAELGEVAPHHGAAHANGAVQPARTLM